MPSRYYGPERYISFDDGLFCNTSEIPMGSLIEINGYKIRKPNRFKNLAHERAFEIALVLAQKKPATKYSQRMGDITVQYVSPVIMTTSECIDVIMFNGISEIQLSIDAVNPRVPAHKAMDYVPSFFESGNAQVTKRTAGNHMWYLELKSEL